MSIYPFFLLEMLVPFAKQIIQVPNAQVMHSRMNAIRLAMKRVVRVSPT